MALSSRTRYSLVAFFLFIVVAVVVLVRSQGDPQEATGTEPSALQDKVAPPAEVGVDAAAEVTEEAPQEVQEPAKRIVHVPEEVATSPHDVDSIFRLHDVTLSNISEVTVVNLNKALEGDIRSAEFFKQIADICNSVPTDEDMIEMRIRWAQRAAGRWVELGRQISKDGISGNPSAVRIYPTVKQNRDHQTQWFRKCRDFNRYLFKEVRVELQEMAQRGHVMARYLYATWVPLMALTSDSLERFQEWQLNSIDFTYSNFTEGHVEGVLAFGETFTHGLFTPRHAALALVLKKAALDCGFEFSMPVENRINQELEFADAGEILGGTVSAQEILDLAASLSSTCQLNKD